MCEAKRNQSAKTDRRCKRDQLPNHGGLTPAALDSVVGVRRTLFAAPCKRDQLPNHGGLTPTALGNVRLYSGNIVFHRERTSCNQERLA
jgi:hypothetical protein